MKHKTSELTDELLDAAVSIAEGEDPTRVQPLRYSRSWRDAGRIIERERITIDSHVYDNGPGQCSGWIAAVAIFGMFGVHYHGTTQKPKWYFGNTPLIAAMRAYVAHKLGEEVELP